MRALGDEMAAAGRPLEDDELVEYILTSLDVDFNPIVSALITKTEPISVNEMYSQLVTFETHMALQSGSGSSANSASRGGRGGNRGCGAGRRGAGRGRSSATFNNNNSPGNYQLQGGRGTSGRGGGNNNTRPICQVCKKTGHTADRCWHRFDEDYVPEERNAAAATSFYNVDTNWYTDTGATDHITGEPEKLATRDKIGTRGARCLEGRVKAGCILFLLRHSEGKLLESIKHLSLRELLRVIVFLMLSPIKPLSVMLVQAKSHRLPYPKSTSKSNHPLELIFSDGWGPAPDSVGKYKIQVRLIDFSKFTWIYLLKFKSEVFQKFCDFHNLVERPFDRKILFVQTDWGGEYEKLSPFFTKIGIMHHVSCPHAHQQNGAAKRKHRHIVEVGLSLLAHASMPLKFWDDVFLSATFLINRIPSRVINYASPLERLFNTKPDYFSLRIFGCSCWPNLIPYNQYKLAFRSKECTFLGYSTLHKGFKCLDNSTGRVYIFRDVVFDEDIFFPSQNSILMQDVDFSPKFSSFHLHFKIPFQRI
ncbi:hypothetical protein U9M48_041059 [Paspalum notatum var. saurae]|uniref:Integrase catalytic domain-containing protein n=1 Tax=Paspalum notatum var. saurae TaxID=547442 RepID=A0AAQ3UTN6_PASNO